jgi:hypothetical protein
MLALAVICACGDDDDDAIGPGGRLIGGDCDDGCVELCARDDEFPGGMCSIRCSNDLDCPDGTACVDKDGGVCAIECDSHADCDGFGLPWACVEVDRRGDGNVFVCGNP